MAEDKVEGTTGDEGFVEPETGVEKKERTRESEIQANIDLLREKGFEFDEADVRAEIEKVPEVEGFDWYTYIPEGISIYLAFQELNKDTDITFSYGLQDELDNFEMPRASEKAYAVAMRYSQEPDEDTLGPNANTPFKLAETNKQFATPLEVIFAEMRWIKDNGSRLDEKNATIFPGTFIKKDYNQIMSLLMKSRGKRVIFEGWGYKDFKQPEFGARQVITAETKTEEK